MKKRIFSIVTALVLAMTLFPATAVPASAATYSVGSSDEFHSALGNVQDGDIIQLTGSFVLKNPDSNNDSLVIDKAVTIQGGSLTLWYAGILLAADVTFKDITLGLASNVRNAIMANGHTLILENVQRDPTTRYIHLFCGGQTGATQGALSADKQGGHGQIIIKGNTDLGLANIYAGSISTDGAANVFDKPATVTIDSSFRGRAIEHIYASGALETPTSPDDWFDYEHEIAPPTPSSTRFPVRPVSGEVTFNLYSTAVKVVNGDTGTQSKYAKVNYKGTNNLNDGLVLINIDGLAVSTGNLVPAAGSSFATADAPLGVAAGATLGLQNLGSEVYVGVFTGGGALVLGASQKLTVVGAVSGTTTVGIGDIFNGHSQTLPDTNGHIYIDAVSSDENSFTLAAPASRPDLKLVRDSNCLWKAAAGENVIIVNDFKLASAVVEPDPAKDVSLAFQEVATTPASLTTVFGHIDLIISIDGHGTTLVDDGFGDLIPSTGTLWLYAGDNGDGTGEALSVYGLNYAPVPTGTYCIEVTVPAANSGTGQPITRTATLTVKAADGGDTIISVPQAQSGLVYTGQEQVGVSLNDAYVLSNGSNVSATDAGSYETKVTPASGFIWENGSTEEKTIPWSIAKANNFDRPTGLGAIPPSSFGAKDGRITGTTAAMEYAANDAFTSARSCAATETTGLAAGNYYVRIAETPNYTAGSAVLVTVPQGLPIVRSIKISDSAIYKTLYQVGEPLDVTGLTLTVTMSDGSDRSVPVFASMVTGFDSCTAGQTKTLTITYSGQTVTYTIYVSDGTGADTIAVTGVTLNKSDMTLAVGSSERLTATVSPDIATNKNVTWTSQNTAVAMVDADGTVTAASAGTVVITATTEDGGKTASCTVTVSANGSGGSTGGGGDSTGDGGGSTSGSGDSTGDSSSSNTSSTTTRNPDGSITTTTTNNRTGAVTMTQTDRAGNKTETVTQKDGSSIATVTRKDGTTATITTSAAGQVEAQVKLSTAAVSAAQERGEMVSLPIPAVEVSQDTASAPTVTVSTGSSTPVKVEIPAAAPTPGTVAVLVRADGTEEVIKASIPMDSGIVVQLLDGTTVKIVDNSKCFSDVPAGNWAADAISFTSARELFFGTDADTFSPDVPMTRAMLVTVLARFDGADVSGGTTWYEKSMEWAIANGVSDGSNPSGNISREQLAVMLWRYAGSPVASASLDRFTDAGEASGYAQEALRWAVENGVISGYGNGRLGPRGQATRAQVAQMLKNLIEKS